ncbi:uncharacterized protein LOC112057396 [Bicyclus anynana]|uniref:Uncharacterized protein LOC112057396 n=1 Tax=Bicyclus anynana TaxID=110368 RepID=A0A6J1P756_BICAN|nr:uncharacterized protein LOC112057396 [Bicyclus anynana]
MFIYYLLSFGTENMVLITSMIRKLSPELAKIAKNELNENPNQVAEDLRHIREWISKQPHLKARTDDQWLIAILRGCKFSLERVKTKLDLFYTLRTTAPEVTLRLKPTEPSFFEFLKLGTCVILRQPKDVLHPSIILIRAGEYNPEKNNVADIMCVLYYLVQILVIENDIATVMGTMIVVDYEKVTLSHLTQASPSILKKLVAVSQDSLPLRFKGSHHVNVPSGIEIIFKLISGFLGEKARNRLRIYKSNEELLKRLPEEAIPVEYGGKGGTINELIDYWASKIEKYKPYLEQELQFGTDESKRVNNGKDLKDLNNQGSFRKLDIDCTMTSIREICPALQIRAQNELNEVPSRTSSDIQALRDWLKKQPHLKSVTPSDQWLIGFLRGNKFSLERSKEKLDMSYTLRSVLPDIAQNRDPFDPVIQDILKMGYYLPIRSTLTEDASRIVLSRFNETCKKHHLIQIVKVCFMIAEIMILEDDNFIIGGEDVLVDLKGAGLNIFTQWTPTVAKQVLTMVEKALPVRMRSCHILHTPPGFEAGYALLKAFISEKFTERFFVYSKMTDAIYDKFPRKVLPVEYGGDNGTIQELIDHWKVKVESYRDWFLLEAEQRSEETLRLGEPKTSSSLFGVEGSFRKLEVD